MQERFTIIIEADKTGPTPEPGDPWPTLGVRIVGEPPQTLLLPVSFVRKHANTFWLDVEKPALVTRPSQPEPAVKNGSADVAPEHALAEVPPHSFVHAKSVTFHTLDGDVKYKVARNPDKYVAGDETGTQKVTKEIYDAGQTEVEHFYTLEKVN